MSAPLLDTSRAQVGRADDDGVLIDDPASPWLVRAQVRRVDGRSCLSGLQIQARHDGACITSARLSRLPTAQILQVAAAELLGDTHAGEIYYRMLATPRPRGTRSWGDDHYRRVLEVYHWAQRTGRAGGGAQAVADLWGVSRRPTVARWLARARRLAARGHESSRK